MSTLYNKWYSPQREAFGYPASWNNIIKSICCLFFTHLDIGSLHLLISRIFMEEVLTPFIHGVAQTVLKVNIYLRPFIDFFVNIWRGYRVNTTSIKTASYKLFLQNLNNIMAESLLQTESKLKQLHNMFISSVNLITNTMKIQRSISCTKLESQLIQIIQNHSIRPKFW